MRKIIFVILSVLTTSLLKAQVSIKSDSITSKPFILGSIETIHSKILGEERILNIYLPDNYTKEDSIKYPVIYLLDGSADEDFIHIVGLIQFNSFEWINRIPKSIVVGIGTVDRRRDFTFPSTIEEEKKLYPTTGHSDLFISFLEHELQPYMDSHFKTNESKTLIGESLGGLLAAEVLFEKPTLFNQYIIVSPSIWWNDASLLQTKAEILEATFKQETKIYIAVGKEGLAPSKNTRVMEVDANLLAEKIKATKSESISVFFDYLPDENHATIMHQAVFNAIKMLNKID